MVYGGVIEAAGVPQAGNLDAVHASNSATVHLYNVRAGSSDAAVYMESRGTTVTAAGTQLDAMLRYFITGGGTLACAGVYDGRFTPLSKSCFPTQ